MDSTVRSRPNHYETLGLKPTATSAEIGEAFAKELRRPRAFGAVAQLSIAYETLRDPAKRRAYDASIGLGPKPDQPPSLNARWNEVQFIGSAIARRAEPIEPARPRSASQANPAIRPQPPAEPRLASFLAESLREPAKPEPRPDAPASRVQSESFRRPHDEARPSGDRLIREAGYGGRVEAEDGSIPWQRTAIGVGALVAAVGLFGVWAGQDAGNDIEAQQPARAVKVALPPAKPSPAIVPSSPRPRSVEEAPPERLAQPALAEAPMKPAPPPPAAALDQQPTAFARAAQSPGLDTAIEAFAAEAPAPAPVAASLGLPNRVVARTIERIGYSCGEIASTTAVEGASGVFKVTCTSGSSYQARPVAGRYRFRRWARQ